MRFTPATKEELEMEGLIEAGVYPFRLTKSEEKTSAKGQPFFSVRLAVFAGGENGQGVFDNPSPEFMKFKLAHLCETTGLGSKYASGNLSNDDLMGVEGYVEIGVQPAKGGYSARNMVVDYLSKEKYDAIKSDSKPAKQSSTPPQEPPDDCPF